MKSTEPTRILVADDDDEFQQFLARAFEGEPYELVAARDGHQALDLATRLLPDLVLLDIGMPGMDGYEVCRRLKEQPSTRPIPVVIVTVRTEEPDILRGFQEGADDFLSKPFSIAHLKAKIRIWLLRGRKPSRPP